MENGKKIAILGAGESGVGAALLARKLGYAVWVSDGGEIKPVFRQKLEEGKIPFEEGHHTTDKILTNDLVVKSPGIPEKVAIVQKIRQAGIELISEIEFGYRHCKGMIIAITGSNGKTTVSMLTHHILKTAGLNAGLAGNVGNSFAGILCEEPKDYYVLEVSSFQLDDVSEFKPHIAIITNITEDHLDRYDNKLENYAAAKMKIAAQQSADDFLIYSSEDPITLQQLEKHKPHSQAIPFTLENKSLEQGAWQNEHGKIILKLKDQEEMDINELALQGKHNKRNSMASGLAGKLLGIRKEAIRDSLAGFESVEHRLEAVMEIYGIQFVNDSKATNVNSTWYALDSMPAPVIWIAGGVDKGNDYSQLFSLVQHKVKGLICLGTDNEKLHREFSDKVDLIIDAADMDEAVRMAYKMGDKGDTVLLSPACASFDLFENYEDRGRQYKEAVRRL